MIVGFNKGDFDLKSPITKIKLHQIKVLYSTLVGSGLFAESAFLTKLKNLNLKPYTLAESICSVCVCLSIITKCHTIFTVLWGYFSKSH